METKSFGKYSVLRPLGSGGMAAVYEARDLLLDRRVAIKVIHPHLAQEGSFADRFRQEARLVAALRHPHIVRLYDFDILDGQPFMVMEYLEGGTLKDRLAQQRPSLGAVAGILSALASALDYAHAQGAVHRDIKPANILFTRHDEPVITDFGIARLLHESLHLSVSGGVIGTPAYMSPEQASGKPVDGRSDQYSLALMVYEMVTGRVPFIGDSAAGVLMLRLTETPLPPRQLNPNLPAPAEKALLRALEKEPSERYPTTQAFAAAFARALQGDGGALDQPSLAPDGATAIDSPPSAVPAPSRPPTPAVETPASPTPPPAALEATLPESAPPIPRSRRDISFGMLRRGGLAAGILLLLVLGAVLFFSLGGLHLFAAQPAAPPGAYTLAVADFDGSQASIRVDFGRRVFEQLQSELTGLGGDVQVVRLEKTYTDAASARAAGQAQGAALLIWGWYDDLGVSPHIEVIQPPANPPERRSAFFLQSAKAAGLAESSGAAGLDLNDFLGFLRVPYSVDGMDLFVQNGPGQLAYISEAVLGMAYQSRGETETALTLYDKAIESATAAQPTSGKSPGVDVLYLQRGLGRARAGRLSEAVSDLESARSANPEMPEAHYNLAILYAEVCSPALRTQDAVASAEEAVRLRPQDIPSRRLLAGLYAQLGRLDEALSAALAARDLDPQDPDTLLLLGSLYGALGQTDEAASSFNQALEILQEKLAQSQGDEAAGLNIALGDAYLQAGKLEPAREAYLKAQSLSPDDPGVHRGLGSLSLQSGDNEDAARELQRWSELDPQNSAAFTLLGLADLKLGREPEMLLAFEKAIALAPCDPDPHLLLGGYYWTGGEQAKAETEYRQAATLAPYNASTSYLLGVTQYLQDDNKEAEAALTQALVLDPKLSRARYALGSLYYSQADYSQALEAWLQVAQDEPGDASVFVSLGNAYDKLGQSEQAIAAYQKSQVLQESPDVHAYLGLIYYQEGDAASAAEEYRKAIQGDPASFLAHSGLGDALTLGGDLQGAVEAYRKALDIQDAPILRGGLVLLLTRLGQVDEAVKELETAVQAAPQEPALLNQLAGLYSRLGRLDEAERQYQALLSLDKSNPQAYFGLGQLAYKRCDLSGMSQSYGQAASLGAGQPLFLSLPASAYAAQGDFDQQSEVIAGLLEQFPTDPLALLLAGEAYLVRGEVRPAEEALQTALQAPSLPPLFQSLAHADLGQAQLERGNPDAAGGEYRQALETFPANAAAQAALGDLALQGGDAGTALEAYDKAIASLPEYGAQVSGDAAELLLPLLEARRVWAQEKLGATADPQLSLDLAQKIVERTPQWPQAHFIFGLVYYSLGQSGAAQVEFGAAQPCDASLKDAIARAKAALDRLR